MFDPKFIIYWLSQNFPYVEKLVRPAALAISVTVTLSQNAEDVDAECVACALEVVVSRFFQSFYNPTSNGFTWTRFVESNITNEEEESFFSLRGDALPKYKLTSLTTHKYLSVGYAANSGLVDLSNLDIKKILQCFSLYIESILRDNNV